jgi:hypothetical protein
MRSSSPTASPGSASREVRYFQEQLSHARARLEAAAEPADQEHWRAMIRRYETVLALYDNGRIHPAPCNDADDRR